MANVKMLEVVIKSLYVNVCFGSLSGICVHAVSH